MRALVEIHCDVGGASGTDHSALDMMRFQRLSPDCHILAGGAGGTTSRKPASAAGKLIKNSDMVAESEAPSASARINDAKPSAPGNSGDANRIAATASGGAIAVAGDLVLQWGHNKRSRCSRSDAGSARPPSKRRSSSAVAERLVPSPAPTLALPRLLSSSSSAAPAAAREQRPYRGAAGGAGEQPAKRLPDKAKPMASNGAEVRTHHHHHLSSDHDNSDLAAGGKSNEAIEKATAAGIEQPLWPRIYLSLSRKEKEDDFLVMKGTKLPQRPKKRAKNVDKALQYCSPGMWLSDLTRGRYEVREKKCVKKHQKRRGLKGMESSDSE